MNPIFAELHGKPEPAGFYDLIEKLTEQGLLHRLAIGLQNMFTGDELQKYSNKLAEAVYYYWHSGDHGIIHSRQVMNRAKEILKACPKLSRFCRLHGTDIVDLLALFTWASILHDIGRFIDKDLGWKHQVFGADLAYHCFRTEINEEIAALLHGMIKHHDYICGFVDGEPLPDEFLEHPWSEVFRLADKTSLSPVDEIVRWYETGKQTDAPFFDCTIPIDKRFAFQQDWQWDHFQYFLLFFSLQPKDWFFGETRDLYRKWAEGKLDVMAKIIELAQQEGIIPNHIDQMINIVTNLSVTFHLPYYTLTV